jgi:hypothetical protein
MRRREHPVEDRHDSQCLGVSLDSRSAEMNIQQVENEGQAKQTKKPSPLNPEVELR